MKIKADSKKIEEILTRGVAELLPGKEGLARLMRKRKIRIYFGIDPTGPDLHLGHAVALLKLKQFQELGHEVIILIGDFTARIGDPTGRLSARRPLTRGEITKNTKNYKKQIDKILDIKKSNVRFFHNEEWTKKLKPENVLELASYFTVSRLLERDMFQKRIKAGKEIYVHEFIYPIFQAYDSVTMKVDVEIGGRDQIFNMLAGRTLMRKILNKEKFVLAMGLLEDSTGRKMGKTEGNMVKLSDKPQEMYGKIMSLSDNLIIRYFELCTEVAQKEIKEMENKLKLRQVNPKDLKARLAREIVSLYHGKKAGELADKEFSRVFKEKKLPSRIPEFKIKKRKINILDLLVETKLAPSKSEAKRLVLQKGVKISGRVIEDWQEVVEVKKGEVIQVGKRRFAEII